MSEPVFQSAMAHAKKVPGSISLSAIDDRGMIDLRGDANNKTFAAAVKKVLGTALPTKPRQSAGKNKITALWLSPDQWLITCPRSTVSKITDKLQANLKNIHSLAVDVSDARSIIRLEGHGAKVVLMKGAPIDLTVPEVTVGYVRRVRFAEIAALVHVISDEPETVDLYVFRSYAQYAWDWLYATSTKQSELHIFCKQSPAEI